MLLGTGLDRKTSVKLCSLCLKGTVAILKRDHQLGFYLLDRARLLHCCDVDVDDVTNLIRIIIVMSHLSPPRHGTTSIRATEPRDTE